MHCILVQVMIFCTVIFVTHFSLLRNSILFLEHVVSGYPLDNHFDPWILSSSGKRRTHRSPDHHLAHFHGIYPDCWGHVSRIHRTLFGSVLRAMYGTFRPQHHHDCISVALASYSMQIDFDG